jgi:error-prone DNA polymerase
MAARAAELGLAGIGIADRNSLAGVVRAHTFARDNVEAMAATRVVPGARLVFTDGSPDVLAYPKDRAAYGRLCRILTEGNLRAPKGECWLQLDDLLERSEGLQVVVMETNPHPSPSAAPSPEGRRDAPLLRLREAFGRRLWIGASLFYGVNMRKGLMRRAALAGTVGAPLIATNDVMMHTPERRALADVLACIREKTTLEAAGRLTQANAERHLKDPREMARLFANAPDAVAETIRFLDGLKFSLDELSHCYPEELREGYATAQEALEAFAWKGAETRYPEGIPERTREALTHELNLIASLDYAPYFLTVHDCPTSAPLRRT